MLGCAPRPDQEAVRKDAQTSEEGPKKSMTRSYANTNWVPFVQGNWGVNHTPRVLGDSLGTNP